MTKNIDLAKLKTEIIETLRTYDTGKLQSMRERLVRMVEGVADQFNVPELRQLVEGADRDRIEALLHIGFLESHFFSALCGDYELAPFEIKCSTKDGNHKVGDN